MEVGLRVRAYGQGVEFALCGVEDGSGRGSGTWWSIAVMLTCAGALLMPQLSGVSSPVLGLVLLVVAGWIFMASGNVIVEESMLVMPSLGVKLSRRRRNGKVTSRFVDQDQICGVAVNEAITFSNVVYSLVLMVKGEDKMVLPYQTFRPRVAVLQEIYSETKKLLFPEHGDRRMHLPEEVAPAPAS